ncbi:hypothetical protein AB0953_16775 [Streptomyces sp. NPDC046866]|uniref:hypothetical protein n=1 Tax=Streptomyces sp. NPDC046866 TaxID=3154921 RepID=UPI003453FD49
MSHIMPDPVADLIPSRRPKPADPIVTPPAVARFSADRRPVEQIRAASTLDLFDAEWRSPEELLGAAAAANKLLSSVPLRQSTEVLS